MSRLARHSCNSPPRARALTNEVVLYYVSKAGTARLKSLSLYKVTLVQLGKIFF